MQYRSGGRGDQKWPMLEEGEKGVSTAGRRWRLCERAGPRHRPEPCV